MRSTSRKPINSIWYSTVSKEYEKWLEGWKYLKANGYTDKGSVETMCEDVGITTELHSEWLIRLDSKE